MAPPAARATDGAFAINLPVDNVVLRMADYRRRAPACTSSSTALPRDRRVFEGGIAAMNVAERARSAARGGATFSPDPAFRATFSHAMRRGIAPLASRKADADRHPPGGTT